MDRKLDLKLGQVLDQRLVGPEVGPEVGPDVRLEVGPEVFVGPPEIIWCGKIYLSILDRWTAGSLIYRRFS
jgi:hypothetical protein